ncbi:release factor glutamine methyltransferase [Candidatus Dependentiae bacterium Noda2021]|nr:release factor glutamine methyltransferase [Candidatus Dependentiae bacterium Noda2021]
MLITQIINYIENALMPRYQHLHTCNQYAWWMLEEITKKTKTQLLILHQLGLTVAQRSQLDDWIYKQVVLHIPLAYLIGSVPFNNVIIDVKSPVLIPRPETEEWVSNLIDALQKIPQKRLSILDLCSGTGCIGLSIAKAFAKSHVVAIDISDEALALGKHNAHKNNIPNITFIRSDLYTDLPPAFTFDLIVSNPPYIAESEWEDLDDSVRKWEDSRALVAPNEGLELIEKIVQNASTYLHPNPDLCAQKINNLYIEIGYRQGAAVKHIFEKYHARNAAVIKDLEGKDRVVTGSFNC